MDGITDSMHMCLGKLWEIVKDREAWHTSVHGVASEKRRPTFLGSGILYLGQCWTLRRYLEIYIKV